jgi:hypothetical protein
LADKSKIERKKVVEGTRASRDSGGFKLKTKGSKVSKSKGIKPKTVRPKNSKPKTKTTKGTSSK